MSKLLSQIREEGGNGTALYLTHQHAMKRLTPDLRKRAQHHYNQATAAGMMADVKRAKHHWGEYNKLIGKKVNESMDYGPNHLNAIHDFKDRNHFKKVAKEHGYRTTTVGSYRGVNTKVYAWAPTNPNYPLRGTLVGTFYHGWAYNHPSGENPKHWLIPNVKENVNESDSWNDVCVNTAEHHWKEYRKIIGEGTSEEGDFDPKQSNDEFNEKLKKMVANTANNTVKESTIHYLRKGGTLSTIFRKNVGSKEGGVHTSTAVNTTTGHINKNISFGAGGIRKRIQNGKVVRQTFSSAHEWNAHLATHPEVIGHMAQQHPSHGTGAISLAKGLFRSLSAAGDKSHKGRPGQIGNLPGQYSLFHREETMNEDAEIVHHHQILNNMDINSLHRIHNDFFHKGTTDRRKMTYDILKKLYGKKAAKKHLGEEIMNEEITSHTDPTEWRKHATKLGAYIEDHGEGQIHAFKGHEHIGHFNENKGIGYINHIFRSDAHIGESYTGPTRMQLQKTYDDTKIHSPGWTEAQRIAHVEKSHGVHSVTTYQGHIAQFSLHGDTRRYEETIVELSKDTIKSYIEKAKIDHAEIAKGPAQTSDPHRLDPMYAHMSKRIRGIKRAGKTLKQIREEICEEKLVGGTPKTATGEKANAVDVQPKLKLQKKKLRNFNGPGRQP